MEEVLSVSIKHLCGAPRLAQGLELTMTKTLPKEKRDAYYGLDLYSTGTFMQAVIKHLIILIRGWRISRERLIVLGVWVEHP